MGYKWIDYQSITKIEEKFPYISITYDCGITFLIDWSHQMSNQLKKHLAKG